MSFETIAVIGLLIFMLCREVMHFFQVSKLQELLKSGDVTEYYRAKTLGKEARHPQYNQIMEEPNEITSFEGEDFDITKVAKLNIDGDERDIRTYS